MGWNAPGFADRRAIRRQIARQGTLKDPEIMQRDLGERLGRHAEILGKHLGRRMGEPVRQQQRVELAGVTVVKADHEFAAVRAETLQRMRLACGKIPEITFIDIRNIGAAHGVENRHAAAAVGHDRPLRRLVPVQFPDATGGQPHVDACDRV
jgi:hypothetical protein